MRPVQTAPDVLPIDRQSLGVVIPVYRAGDALRRTCAEILTVLDELAVAPTLTVALTEIVLVCDNPRLPDADLAGLDNLTELDSRLRIVWLSNNFGQHPATIAGIVSTNSDWVLTMDEDGQHDPRFVAAMLHTAGTSQSPLVYAAPTNARPHGALRNAGSWLASRIARAMTKGSVRYHSYRLIEGSLARAACAYAGENVFLDVALGWTCGPASTCPVNLRAEDVSSSYSFRRLLSHFWKLILSSGTRPLRLIALGGAVVAATGMLAGAYIIIRRLSGEIIEPGWTSVIVALLVLFGGLYVALAILAEYIGLVVHNTIGRPAYVKVDGLNARALFSLRLAILAQPTSASG